MSGNTIGEVHAYDVWREPRTGARRSRRRVPARPRPHRVRRADGRGSPALGHLALHESASRARQGADPVRSARRQDDRDADRSARRECRPALVRLREDQGPVSSWSRRLHVSRSTASAIRAAAADRPHAKPSCAWQPARSRASCCAIVPVYASTDISRRWATSISSSTTRTRSTGILSFAPTRTGCRRSRPASSSCAATGTRSERA